MVQFGDCNKKEFKYTLIDVLNKQRNEYEGNTSVPKIPNHY